MRHRSSNAPISCIPNSNPHSNFLILSSYLNRPYPTPTLCGFHLGFGLDYDQVASAGAMNSINRNVRVQGNQSRIMSNRQGQEINVS